MQFCPKTRAPITIKETAQRAAYLTKSAVQSIVDPQRIAAAARCPSTGQSINWTKICSDHWTEAAKPSSQGRRSMCSTAQHSTAQHSTAQHSTAQHSTAQHSTAQRSAAQHKSCHVKVSRSQMIVSRMCRHHHYSAAVNAVVLTGCCQFAPVCNLGQLQLYAGWQVVAVKHKG